MKGRRGQPPVPCALAVSGGPLGRAEHGGGVCSDGTLVPLWLQLNKQHSAESRLTGTFSAEKRGAITDYHAVSIKEFAHFNSIVSWLISQSFARVWSFET